MYCISSVLKLIRIIFGLLGGEDFYKFFLEVGKIIGLVDVMVKGGGIKLGKDVNFNDFWVDVIIDGNIDEVIFFG